MRVLILADDCNPDWPSLPVVGYKAARAISEYADVVVATHIRNRENIEKTGFGRAEVLYIDNEYVARPMFRLGRWLRGGDAAGWTTAIAIAYPSYLAFEWEVWRKTRDKLRRGEFDLVHRLTPMSPTLPSPMAAWSPVPFVLGPLNGGLRWPREFREELSANASGYPTSAAFTECCPIKARRIGERVRSLRLFRIRSTISPGALERKQSISRRSGSTPNCSINRAVDRPANARTSYLSVGSCLISCLNWSCGHSPSRRRCALISSS